MSAMVLTSIPVAASTWSSSEEIFDDTPMCTVSSGFLVEAYYRQSIKTISLELLAGHLIVLLGYHASGT